MANPMLRRWSLATVAAVIVWGVLVGVIPIRAEAHPNIGWRRPKAGEVHPVVGAPLALENIKITDRAIDKDSLPSSPNVSDLFRRRLLIGEAISGDARRSRDGRGIEIVDLEGSCHQMFIGNRGYGYARPMSNAVGWRGSGIFDFGNCNDTPQVVRFDSQKYPAGVQKKIGSQFASGCFASFNQSPYQGGCGYRGGPKRSYGEPKIEAGHTVGFSDLIDRRPLGAKVGIFWLLRILAVGLIAFGYRLTSHVHFEARMTGGLIIVAGMALLAGVIELIGYA